MRKLLVCIMIAIMISTASGLPEILDGFNIMYDTFKTRLDNCDTCHIPNKPKKAMCETCHITGEPVKDLDLNQYGGAIKNNLNKEMMKAFKDIENLDSDGDKYSNKDEIRNLTFPGDKRDFPKKVK